MLPFDVTIHTIETQGPGFYRVTNHPSQETHDNNMNLSAMTCAVIIMVWSLETDMKCRKIYQTMNLQPPRKTALYCRLGKSIIKHYI